jgi:hypothetical protein
MNILRIHYLYRCIVRRLGRVSGPGYIHADRVQSDLHARPQEFAAALRELEQAGEVEFTAPGRQYVRATGRRFAVTAD